MSRNDSRHVSCERPGTVIPAIVNNSNEAIAHLSAPGIHH
jgi:hypothetical protein